MLSYIYAFAVVCGSSISYAPFDYIGVELRVTKEGRVVFVVIRLELGEWRNQVDDDYVVVVLADRLRVTLNELLLAVVAFGDT